MTNLEKAKKIIRANIKDAEHGLFFTQNIVGDTMATIYKEKDENDIRVDICYDWGYFEVFGLCSKEQKELMDYYEEFVKLRQEFFDELMQFIIGSEIR